jgi:hypothetical protein
MSNSRTDLDFVRDTLVTALYEKRDAIVGDLFKMYEQVQNRPTNINIDKLVTGMGTEYNFNLSSDYLNRPGGDMDALDNVIDFGNISINTNSDDTITFN